jgi:hypothetical protein
MTQTKNLLYFNITINDNKDNGEIIIKNMTIYILLNTKI